MELKTVADAIREIRGETTQAEFAKKLDISQSFLSELETGKKLPGKNLIKELAKLSGYPLERFF